MSLASEGPSAAAPPAFCLAWATPGQTVTSLRHAQTPAGPEFIRPGACLGPVRVRARRPGDAWREVAPGHDGVAVASRLEPVGAALVWDITIDNATDRPLEVGDLELPLPMHTDYVWDATETFERRVFRHAPVAGHGSFLYWLPVRGTGPILVLQPQGDTGLEYFTASGMDYAMGGEHFSVFIHSWAAAEQEPRGSWRLARSRRCLPAGQRAAWRLAFRWAMNYEDIRQLLYEHGGADVRVAPGMVIPCHTTVRLAVRSRQTLATVHTEFAATTTVAGPYPGGDGYTVFELAFARLGENLVTLGGPGGWSMPLEFFVTEPLATLIHKRAAFIARQQQHRCPDRWYDGLFSLWDRRQPRGQNLLGPDHLGGQPPYAVSGSDDPCNGKCLLLAEKNVAYPDAAEIAALEYFARVFVWGRHQRTDAEAPFPYGIYGADSWYENRGSQRDPLSAAVSRPGGPSACRLWRTFDYPTYIALYYNLYRIACQRPDLTGYLDAAGYLERALGTARAYFQVPAAIRMEGGWSFTGWVHWQYTIGNFHERYLLPLIDALAANGRQADADDLRQEWEKKVKYFIYDGEYAFASEMPVDATAYESTYAAARYALEQGLQPDPGAWTDRNSGHTWAHPHLDPERHRRFLDRQHLANLACRGVLETHYWSLGSDFRGCGSASYTLSYMSPMGGWAVLDYALRYDPAPADNLRLGYASLLSSWALVNSGDAASDYGFWTPGPQHDGAASWGFQPRQVGSEWNPATSDLPRGAWPVCGEIDHGLVAAIEAACTVVFDDPIFGWLAYGGDLRQDAQGMQVTMHDGVGQRLHVVSGSRRLHLCLDRDGWAADEPVCLSWALDRLDGVLVSRAPHDHTVRLVAEGLVPGVYELTVAGASSCVAATADAPTEVAIPVSGGAGARVQLVRRA